MKKNDVFIAEIVGYGSDGEGIARFDDTTCFVPFSVLGEKCEIKALKVKNNIAYCKIERIIERSEDRIEPKCSVFGKCGGCQLQHIKYEKQIIIKQQNVKNCFKKIAHIDIEVAPSVVGNKIYEYRNKLQLPLRSENSIKKIGFFRSNTHNVIDIDSCPLHADFCKDLIKIIKSWSVECNVSFYDEQTKSGALKHLVVRKIEDKYLITLVSSTAKINAVNRLIQALIDNFNHFSLLLNINRGDNNVVLGEKTITLYGEEKIAVEENSITYHIGTYSFMQVNDEQKKKLYNDVINACDIDEKTVVIDGYSGAGVLTAMLSRRAKLCYGVEIVPQAHESAVELAKLNGIDNMIPVLGDCANVLPKILSDEKISKDKKVLILDPPRKGVDSKVLTSALNVLPDKIIYISCNPSTLARDVGILTGTLEYIGGELKNATKPQGKYKIDSVTPYDMFPMTKHVETLCVLNRI